MLVDAEHITVRSRAEWSYYLHAFSLIYQHLLEAARIRAANDPDRQNLERND